jgi:uncharacterized membrane protein YfcA
MPVLLPLLGIGIVLGTMSQRISGMGFALLMAPVFVMSFGAYEGILLMNIGGVFSSALMLMRVWRYVDWQKFWVLLAASIPGAAAGAFVATQLESSTLQVMVGVLLMTGLAIMQLAKPSPGARNAHTGSLLAGLASGFTNGTAGFGSPALAIYALYTRWDQRRFAATLQPLFIVMSLAAFTLKTSLSGQPPALDWWVYPGLVVLIVVGSVLGERVKEFMAGRGIKLMVISLSYIGAIAATVSGVWNMLHG